MIKNSTGEKVYKVGSSSLCVSSWGSNTIRILVQQGSIDWGDNIPREYRAQIFLNEEEALHLYHYLGWLFGK